MSGKVINCKINLQHNYRKQLAKGLPDYEDDNYGNDGFVEPVTFTGPAELRNELDELLEELFVEIDRLDDVTYRGKHLETFKEHIEWFVLSLVANFYRQKLTAIQLQDEHYRSGSYLNMIGLRHSRVKSISEALTSIRFTDKIKHSLSQGSRRSTRLWPSEGLLGRFYKFHYYLTYKFTPPYVKINEQSDNWSETFSVVLQDSTHPDVKDMTKINEFLYKHTWANKGPVRLIYNTDPFHGGRLYTQFQNLRSRNVKERINTLIDGEPICEVDYNANHLRMSLAVFAKQDAGETPYEDIAAICGESRSVVKGFITRCMGADNASSALKSYQSEKGEDKWNKQRFEAILNATYKRYPELEMFGGVGVKLQSLEGAILKRVMLRGVDEDIVCLPIHDAIACKAKDAEWVEHVMTEEWTREVGTVIHPKIKTSFAEGFLG